MALLVLQATFPPCLSRWGKESRTPARPDLLPPLPHCQGSPPASLQHPGQAQLSQGGFWPKNQPQPCSNFPVQTAGADLASLKAAPGKPKSILFRQTDLPSIMKLPHSLICSHQQCWQCQEEQPPSWLSAGGVHSTLSHAEGMQFIPHHK